MPNLDWNDQCTSTICKQPPGARSCIYSVTKLLQRSVLMPSARNRLLTKWNTPALWVSGQCLKDALRFHRILMNPAASPEPYSSSSSLSGCSSWASSRSMISTPVYWGPSAAVLALALHQSLLENLQNGSDNLLQSLTSPSGYPVSPIISSSHLPVP